MSKLSLVDQIFYKLEAGGMSHMLMGGAMIIDPATSKTPLNAKIVADHLASRLEKVPLLRKKLVQDKLKIGHMRLVDDPSFDINHHITYTTLKAPGNYQIFTDYVAEFSAQRVDLNKPLWHYEVVDGLEGGRIAVCTHLHHSLLDGIGAMEALSGMWDLTPKAPEQPQQHDWQLEPEPSPSPSPSPRQLLQEALLENVDRLYIKSPQFLFNNSKAIVQSLAKTLVKKVAGQESNSPRVSTPKVHKTSFNRKVSETRAISYVEFPLAKIKALGKQHQCSVNDIVILLNSYALTHYFEQIGETIDFDLVALMPINTRQEGDEVKGNIVSAARLSLHNQLDDTKARLKAIVSDTVIIKQANKPSAPKASATRVDSKALMGLFSPVMLDALVYSLVKTKLSHKIAFANLGITNVPGSPVPLFLAGAKLVSMVPMAPVVDGTGLTVTVSSTHELLVIGYHSCGEALQDKKALVEGAALGFSYLEALS